MDAPVRLLQSPDALLGIEIIDASTFILEGPCRQVFDEALNHRGFFVWSQTLFLLSLALLLAVAFYLMGELKFLVPYRAFLFREYGWALAVFFGVLFLNIFAGAFVLIRKSFLKDTGRKLSHIDKQFHVGNVHLPADSDYDERT